MSQEIWWAGTILHIICLSLFFLLWEKFCHSCLLECSTKISCSREIHCPVKCLWDSDSHLCSLTWAHSPWETVWWDINRLESEALFLFCSFSSLISFSGLGWGEWAQLCEAAVPALSCSTVTAEFPSCLLCPAPGSFQGSQGRCLLEWGQRLTCTCLQTGDHTAGTRGLSQPSFSGSGFLCFSFRRPYKFSTDSVSLCKVSLNPI